MGDVRLRELRLHDRGRSRPSSTPISWESSPRAQSWGTFAWTLALSVSYALVIFTAPIIGAYADAHAAKKKLLAITTSGCVLGTALLSLVGPGDLALAFALIVLSNVFFGTGENIAAAFLPELAKGEAMGKVSAWGWSLGYIGGLITLARLLGVRDLGRRSGPNGGSVRSGHDVDHGRHVCLGQLVHVLVAQGARAPAAGGRRRCLARAGARRRRRSVTRKQYKDLLRFLGCIVLYQSGVQTVIALAAIYAQEAMGFTTQDTIVLVLLVNITASLGAFLFGRWQDRLGHRRTLAFTLLGWCSMVLIAYLSTGQAGFWVAANIAGLCLGASQSAGRALVGYLAPADRHAEFFGLWGLAVKLASILGPLSYGAVTWLTDNDHRSAMLDHGRVLRARARACSRASTPSAAGARHGGS